MTLEEILKEQGLESEKVAAVLAKMKESKLYVTTEENAAERLKKYKEQKAKLEAELSAKTKNGETAGGELEQLKAKNAELENKLLKSTIDSKLTSKLMSLKATDLDYMKFKAMDGVTLELDEKWEIKGLDDIVKGLQEKYPNQFNVEEGRRVDPNILPIGKQGNNVPKSLESALDLKYKEGEN